MSHPRTTFSPNERKQLSFSLTEIIRLVALRCVPKSRKKYVEILAVKLWNLAITGNITAAQMIWERLDGKVSETREITQKAPLVVLHTHIFATGGQVPAELKKIEKPAEARLQLDEGE